MGCGYIPLVPAAEEERHYAALMEDILGFQEKGQVVVLGDFNARLARPQPLSTSLAGLGKPTPMPAVSAKRPV